MENNIRNKFVVGDKVVESYDDYLCPVAEIKEVILSDSGKMFFYTIYYDTVNGQRFESTLPEFRLKKYEVAQNPL